MKYADRFSWRHWRSTPDGDVLVHNNQSLSLAFEWDGVSIEMVPESRQNAIIAGMRKAFESFSDEHDLYIENHFSRDYHDEIADEYLEYGKQHMVRDVNGFGMAMRESLANHIRQIGMRNRIFTVITLKNRIGGLDWLLPKRATKRQKATAKKLFRCAKDYMGDFPGARLLGHEAFEKLIFEHYHRELKSEDNIPGQNHRFFLNERIARKPIYEDGLLRLGNHYHKIISLIDYPDADIDWFYQIARYVGLEIHVTQILKKADTKAIMQSSAKEQRRNQDSTARVGSEEGMLNLEDNAEFRMFVKRNNLSVFNNAYIIKLIWPDKGELIKRGAAFEKMLAGCISMGDSKEIAYSFWRYSQFAQGHLCLFSRPDHSALVANMAPVINFDRGDRKNLQMLRLTADAQPITLAYLLPSHAFTVGKTGAGKGVEMISEIAELFPLGVNFYGAEYGETYRWVTEAFGGDYFNLSDDTVVSPFPEYVHGNPNDKENPLPADLVSASTETILPVLVRANQEQQHHIKTVAEKLLKQLYISERAEGFKAPTLDHFFKCGEQAANNDIFQGAQRAALDVLCENLYTFLESQGGSNFKSADNISFNSGIAFCNFKPIQDKDLRQFLLMFMALRFKQMAFTDPTPTRIIIDELHEFNAIDPANMQILLRQVTRMGRKENSAFHGVTQGVVDLDLDSEIVKQLTHRLFLYNETGHQGIAKRFNMDESIYQRWENYPDPQTPNATLNYRQGIRFWGKRPWDLHLSFPQMMLDVSDSGPRELELKDEINKIYPNGAEHTFERIAMFRERINQSKVA